MNKNSLIYVMVILGSLIIAARFPITNDEAYYIAFARNLQLSYIDAPPFVAYLNIIQMRFGLIQPIFARLFVIILHLISVLLLMSIVKTSCKEEVDLSDRLLITFLLCYVIPVFGLYGIFILPDTGLILGLSVMLYAADKVYRSREINILNMLILGFGLGIGALSKYHILPLGGGILFGLLLSLCNNNSVINKGSQSSHTVKDISITRPPCTLLNALAITNLTSCKFLIKLLISTTIGLMIALPVFIWNQQHHYASFMFQLQHGFSSDKWQIMSCISFIIGAMLYLTPWFAYVLFKKGLLTNKKFHILVPFVSLTMILLISSLRKNILPHWFAPAFWLLIPYTVIACKNLQPLKTMCKYTSVIWVILLFLLILPNGLSNVKYISKQFNPDTTGFADLLLWQELPQFVAANGQIQQSISSLYKQNLDKCADKQPVVATTKWYWASQLEFHHVFPRVNKILNLDTNSASFYLWRDDLSKYANCPILFIANNSFINLQKLGKLITINNSYTIHGIDDYKLINLIIIDGVLKDSVTLNNFQKDLINHPKY